MRRKVQSFCLLLLLFVLPAVCQTAPASQAATEARVDSMLKQLSLEEKIDLLGGVDDFYIRAIPRIGLPRLKMADGPVGVRNYGPSTVFGGIGLAATWDPALAQRIGAVIGEDARARGVHFMLGPGVNIYRAPLCGRNFEYFGEDPFLSSRTAVAYIEGMQSQGVSATIKHFMGNNSEYDRHNTDSIIDERTMREIYLPMFEAAVKEAHVGAVMDSYNLTNGQHMTQNGYLNTDVAKKDWGFTGIMMSDWDFHLRRRGGGERRSRSRDAVGKIHEPRHVIAGREIGQGERGNHRRQSPPHPAHRDSVWMARPRADRPIDSQTKSRRPTK